MILMIDNYDSFTYNLVQELAEISGAEIEVVRNDAGTADELIRRRPKAIVISPGPGTPDDAGVSMDLIREAAETPVLGICLGLQSLAAVHGGAIVRAPTPVHGKTSEIHHDGTGVMTGLPEPFVATRYHSLVVDRATVPDVARNHRLDRRRAGHGVGPPRTAAPRGAVPPRVVSQREWNAAVGEFSHSRRNRRRSGVAASFEFEL